MGWEKAGSLKIWNIVIGSNIWVENGLFELNHYYCSHFLSYLPSNVTLYNYPKWCGSVKLYIIFHRNGSFHSAHCFNVT